MRDYPFKGTLGLLIKAPILVSMDVPFFGLGNFMFKIL